MIKIVNLSEGQEDFFLLQIIRETGSKVNILIDGGKSEKKCRDKLKEYEFEKLDYIILTHIDSDHIHGLMGLFDKHDDKYKDTVIVYNKFINGMVSYKQAEKFEKMIENRNILVSYKEYQDNKGDIIFLSKSQRQKLKRNKEKIYITFLSPLREVVENLYNAYHYYKENNKIIPNNAEIVNRSSIMFLLEYKNSAILMLGDGYISDIIKSIDLLSDEKNAFEPIKKVSLIKLPHHGSAENNTELHSLLLKIHCEMFILTNSDESNVQIHESLKNELKGKDIYSANLCEKYEGLKVVCKREIEIKE